MLKSLRIAALAAALSAAGALAESNTPPPDIGSDPNFIAAKKAIAAKQWDKALYSLKYVKSQLQDSLANESQSPRRARVCG